ncbi:MAG: hypothetical protein HDT20_04360 [Oscillibacter sp.]|nr:hypothetical protein [Oscillibacter sp.]
MKPILFNTDMVRAILEDCKTVTRRVVKLKYSNTHLEMFTNKYGTRLVEKQNEEPGVTTVKNSDGTTTHKLLACVEKTPPYCPGDILYVRETWAQMRCFDCSSEDCEANIDRSGLTISCNDGVYIYRATDLINTPQRWRPSIHMPREAARIFLRVTDVRAERLQDSFFTPGATIFSCQKEGIDIGDQCRDCIDTYGCPCCIDENDGDDEKACECGVLDDVRSAFADLWNNCYAQPRPVKGENGVIIHYESYPWEDIQETRTYKGKPWYVIGNPWVWVIEFERISREEAVSRAVL